MELNFVFPRVRDEYAKTRDERTVVFSLQKPDIIAFYYDTFSSGVYISSFALDLIACHFNTTVSSLRKVAANPDNLHLEVAYTDNLNWHSKPDFGTN
ncbi:hypothetical protein ColLi_00062 [Colletotrichum liriopes]|uniref:Uncharacterized protein n=1 Tax=Colletotrichum liriopes TaxID=708192 RepID=A0AA37GAQ9_9PEZI|nr:hypothetical protein ColLi_00062 [Colletotrichum liriopes]